MTLGAGLGGQSAAYGAQAGRFITQGAQAATPYQYQAASYNPYANILQGIGTNPYLAQAFQPYSQAQQAIRQYGASNVYGFGGQGTVPTSVNWDLM